MAEIFEEDIRQCIRVLESGGVILYPADTGWSLGCDASNETAIAKISQIKPQGLNKNLTVLVAEERDILHYVAGPDPAVFSFLEEQLEPITIIFDGGIGLPESLLDADGSIAIQLVKDPFCRHLVKRWRKPIVATSANCLGEPVPAFYDEVEKALKDSVDYMVQWRQEDKTMRQTSKIIRWRDGGAYELVQS